MKNCEHNSFFFLNFIKINESFLSSSLLKRINEELSLDNQITERNVEAFHSYFSKVSLFHIKYWIKFLQYKEQNNDKKYQDKILKYSIIFLCFLIQFRNKKNFEVNCKYGINDNVRKIRKIYAFIDDFIMKTINVIYHNLSLSNFNKILNLLLLLSIDCNNNIENPYTFKILLESIYYSFIHKRKDLTKEEIDIIKEKLKFILDKVINVDTNPKNSISKMYNANIFLLSKYSKYSRILFKYSELITIIKDENERKEIKELLIKIIVTIFKDSFSFNTVIHPLVDIMLTITNNMDSKILSENQDDLILSSFPINLIQTFLQEEESHSQLPSSIFFNGHKDIPKISVEGLTKDFLVNALFDIFFSFHFIPKDNQVFYPIFTIKKGSSPYISIHVKQEEKYLFLMLNKTEKLTVVNPNTTYFFKLKEKERKGDFIEICSCNTEKPIQHLIQLKIPCPNKKDEDKYSLTYGYDDDNVFNGLLGSLIISKQFNTEEISSISKYYEDYLFVNSKEDTNPIHNKIREELEKVYCLIHPKMFQFVNYNDNVDDNLRIEQEDITKIKSTVDTFTNIILSNEEIKKKKITIPPNVIIKGCFNKYCHIVIEENTINNFISSDGLNTLMLFAEYQYQMVNRISKQNKETIDEIVAQM